MHRHRVHLLEHRNVQTSSLLRYSRLACRDRLVSAADIPAAVRMSPCQARADRARLVLAATGEHSTTELTYFVSPDSFLRRCGVADVYSRIDRGNHAYIIALKSSAPDGMSPPSDCGSSMLVVPVMLNRVATEYVGAAALTAAREAERRRIMH
jgi:hypothetical protein